MNIDDFGSLLNDSLHSEQPGAAITALAQRLSYVFPDDRVLSVLAGLGPLVEMGAGTGYWAYRLRTLGVDIVALDLAPPDGARSNRYHPSSPTWTKVIAGDHTVLGDYPDRALLLCWPPLFSRLGESLTYYAGNTVALIGDGGHRTSRLTGLSATFSNVAVFPVRALDPFPGAAPTLSVWKRRPAP